jgi:hypothetical protein
MTDALTLSATLEPVRCLDCGTGYGKPSGGGTLSANPGCPHCGYVGWLSASASVTGAPLHGRFAADRRRRRPAPPG